MTTRIGFPGLGIEMFEMNRTAFTVFGVDIQWYGILLSTGIVLAFLLFYRLGTKQEHIKADDIYNVTLFTVPVAIIGARFVYVITNWDSYKDKGFLNMINIRGGGIAIYGAIIFGLLTVIVYNRVKKVGTLSMLDALAPAVMLGQTIGRWGNFVNGEAYGWSEGVEKLPWRMQLDHTVLIQVNATEVRSTGSFFAHPTFLYESLWNLVGLCIILFVFYRRKKFNGQIFLAYMGWYGLGRGFIEMLRTDSLYITGTSVKFSVFTGFLCLAAAIVMWVVLSRRARAQRESVTEYKSEFAAAAIAVSRESDALDDSVFDTDTNTEEADNTAGDNSSEKEADDGGNTEGGQ